MVGEAFYWLLCSIACRLLGFAVLLLGWPIWFWWLLGFVCFWGLWLHNLSFEVGGWRVTALVGFIVCYGLLLCVGLCFWSCFVVYCLLLGMLNCCGLRVNSVVIDAITHALFVRFAVCCVLVWLLSCSVWFGLLLVDFVFVCTNCLCWWIMFGGFGLKWFSGWLFEFVSLLTLLCLYF